MHHCTWRAGVLGDSRRRVENFAFGAWDEHSPAVRDEAGRPLDHTDRHHGRIDVADPRLGFLRVTLDGLPAGWATEARGIVTR
ncbi:hypothetical protein M1P56_12780 [Streptomyces sp. HU2014]|uniref:hypothetical protein n=1 Tax=Streptomyces sp. HU2014 TaxID=2939414 RepID=UPI0020105B4A|nr:hypothetical protein [Streptomyces sp. HU2014]UQI45159.1 hypothetical protein M1P56_12780 [Streptomyces sp. HU2014]